MYNKGFVVLVNSFLVSTSPFRWQEESIRALALNLARGGAGGGGDEGSDGTEEEENDDTDDSDDGVSTRRHRMLGNADKDQHVTCTMENPTRVVGSEILPSGVRRALLRRHRAAFSHAHAKVPRGAATNVRSAHNRFDV